jgi:hypothetical protein
MVNLAHDYFRSLILFLFFAILETKNIVVQTVSNLDFKLNVSSFEMNGLSMFIIMLIAQRLAKERGKIFNHLMILLPEQIARVLLACQKS